MQIIYSFIDIFVMFIWLMEFLVVFHLTVCSVEIKQNLTCQPQVKQVYLKDFKYILHKILLVHAKLAVQLRMAL
jgi:hypothetical protein